MLNRHGLLSRRDALLLLIGASSMHLWSILFGNHLAADSQSIATSTNVFSPVPIATVTALRKETRTRTKIRTQTVTVTAAATPTLSTRSSLVLPFDDLPSTELLAHAPGWTLFRNLYMSNGTLFIVADDHERQRFPEIRLMTSTGLAAENTPENIAMREPTDKDMMIISPEEARNRWTSTPMNAKARHLNRVLTVEGNTVSGYFTYISAG